MARRIGMGLALASAISSLLLGSAPAEPANAQEQAAPQRPNVLIVLLDDVGFAADSTFGGPIPTPVLDRIAAEGVRYNRFHVTAMCSPTRAALLTGRNHHRVNMGVVANIARDEPGYTSFIPDSAATIADVLGDHGYMTAWFGKNHLTPVAEQTAAGPFDRWPTGFGFDHFYGFMDGASDQFRPLLIRNTTPLDPVPDPTADPGYILDRDLADQAISWLDRTQDAAPERPFLLYFAPGSVHEPHQAPPEWIARYRGAFDMGWDALRTEIFARQQAAGIIPATAALTPRPDLLPAWDSLSPDQQRVAARMMEVFAAQRAHLDYQFGRIVEALRARGEWDNTLVLFINGDNGSSAEGMNSGTILGLLNRPQESTAYHLAHLDGIGGEQYGSNYPAAWGWALNTPFPWFKQIASSLGGTRAGLVVRWPGHVPATGEIREQYAHVTDIAPTIYAALGITAPASFDGVAQLPLDGASLLPSFADPAAPSAHTAQYYEMMGNVGMYRDGWLAVQRPITLFWAPPTNDAPHWELFDLSRDFSQAHDVAAQHPEIVAALAQDWEQAQADNGFRHVVRRRGELPPPLNGTLHFQGHQQLTYRRGDGPFLDSAFPGIAGRGWRVRVPVVVDAADEGTLISQGGAPFGWGLYLIGGRPTFLYVNEPGEPFRLEGPVLSPGAHVIELGLEPLAPGSNAPAQAELLVDGASAASARLAATVPSYWGGTGTGIGREVGAVMLPEMAKPFAFTGEMGALELELQPATTAAH